MGPKAARESFRLRMIDFVEMIAGQRRKRGAEMEWLLFRFFIDDDGCAGFVLDFDGEAIAHQGIAQGGVRR